MKRTAVLTVLITFLLATISFAQDSFEQWLKRGWNHPVQPPAGIFGGRPRPTVFVYLDYEVWHEAKPEWQNKAAHRMACSLPLTYASWQLSPPYTYKLLVPKEKTGGEILVITEGKIEADTCSSQEKSPIINQPRETT